MQTLRLKTRAEKYGRLAVSIPTPLHGEEVEVTVTYRPLPEEPLDAMGRPVGWIDRTAGSIPDRERLPQGEYETREE